MKNESLYVRTLKAKIRLYVAIRNYMHACNVGLKAIAFHRVCDAVYDLERCQLSLGAIQELFDIANYADDTIEPLDIDVYDCAIPPLP